MKYLVAVLAIIGLLLAAPAMVAQASVSERSVPLDSPVYAISEHLGVWQDTAGSGFGALSEGEAKTVLSDRKGVSTNALSTRLADTALSLLDTPTRLRPSPSATSKAALGADMKIASDSQAASASLLFLGRMTLSVGDWWVYDGGARFWISWTQDSGAIHVREDDHIFGGPNLSLHVAEETFEWGRGKFGRLPLSTSQHDPFLAGPQERHGLNPEMKTVSLDAKSGNAKLTLFSGALIDKDLDAEGRFYFWGQWLLHQEPDTAYISGIRAELRPLKNLSIGVGDTVLTNHPLAFGLLVSDPLQYFGLLSGSMQGVQQLDSNLIGFVDAEYVRNRTKYYGEFIWDSTLDPSDAAIQGTVPGPKTGLLLGVARALSPERLVRAEYVTIDPTVYTFHRDHKFAYWYKGAYMGHRAGPDAKNLVLSFEEVAASNRLSLVALELEERGTLSPRGAGGKVALHASQSGPLNDRISFQWGITVPLDGGTDPSTAKLGLIFKLL